MTDAEILNAAADLIERYGLYKRDNWPGRDFGREWDQDPLCVYGALALIGQDVAGPVDKLESTVGRWISYWNDVTSQAEVVATLRAVAAS